MGFAHRRVGFQAMDYSAGERHVHPQATETARCAEDEQLMKQRPPATRNGPQDLVRTISSLWIWGAPAALLLAAEAAWHAHRLPTTAAGLVFTVSTAWIGIACYINGRRCGRIHCLIDGYLLPPLALLGLLNVAGITSITWQSYLNILLLIVIASFVLECCCGNHLRRAARAPNEKDEASRPGAGGGQP
jgi:hypothetical protein